MERLTKTGTVTVGTKFDQPLFGQTGIDGTPTGFDVEITKIITRSLGIADDKVKFIESISTNREPFIEKGTVDFVVATYAINEKRKELISFAGPYYTAGQSILVLSTNSDIKSSKDLVGKKVCSVTDSTPAKKLTEIGALPILTATYTNCLEPVRNGQAVAVSTDNVALAGLASTSNGEFKVVGDTFTAEPYGIGVKKDDATFRSYINDVLEVAEKDGSYKAAWESTAGKFLPYVAPPAINRY